MDSKILSQEILRFAPYIKDFDTHKALIEKALIFANDAHAWQVRKYGGEEYITHPIAVALDVTQRYGDIDLTIAALLHDTAEDNDDISVEDIYHEFWPTVWYIVDAVTQNDLFFYEDPTHLYKDRIEKILAGWLRDVRVLLVKIGDRDHNLLTLEGLQPQKQIKMTFETQAIYVPLKELLHYEKDCTIPERQTYLDEYIQKNNIHTATEFKHTLYNETFEDFDDETFDLVYGNSNKIVWRIEDKERFEKLLSLEWFTNHITIINLRTDGKNFKASFQFTKGQLINTYQNNKFWLYSFRN